MLTGTAENRRGILLVGHGTQDSGGMAECQALAGIVARAIAPVPVELAFIELAEPSIAEGIDRLVLQGFSRLSVMPLLLFGAGHAKADVPVAVRDAIAGRMDIAVEILSPFGLDRRIVQLSQRRFDEALVGCQPRSPRETYWLLVGRGSSDSQATGEFGRFAVERAKRSSLEHFGCSFVAAARPTLGEGVSIAIAAGLKRIVVQPHLLFRGAVLEEINGVVARCRSDHPAMEWITVAHLGPAQEVVDAITDRIRE